MDTREAILHLLIAALRADGFLQESELRVLDETLQASGLFPGEDTRALVDAALILSPGLSELAAHVPPELRARVFGLCADLAVSDGRLVREETLLLERIRQALQLSRETADHLLASATSRRVLKEQP